MVFDPTRCENELEQQLCFLEGVCYRLRRTGAKAVIAITKCDLATTKTLSLIKTKIRDRLPPFPLFETSAHDGVSVDAPFWQIFAQAQKGGVDVFLLSYNDGCAARDAAVTKARGELREELNRFVNDFSTTWSEFTRALGSRNEALAAVWALEGRSECTRLFFARLVKVKLADLRDVVDECEATTSEGIAAWKKTQLRKACLNHPDLKDVVRSDCNRQNP